MSAARCANGANLMNGSAMLSILTAAESSTPSSPKRFGIKMKTATLMCWKSRIAKPMKKALKKSISLWKNIFRPGSATIWQSAAAVSAQVRNRLCRTLYRNLLLSHCFSFAVLPFPAEYRLLVRLSLCVYRRLQ